MAGWQLNNRGWNTVGSLCWAIPWRVACQIVQQFSETHSKFQVDANIGKWALVHGMDTWLHVPSLGQHIGRECSALKKHRDVKGGNDHMREAADFIGEDASALECVARWTPPEAVRQFIHKGRKQP